MLKKLCVVGLAALSWVGCDDSSDGSPRDAAAGDAQSHDAGSIPLDASDPLTAVPPERLAASAAVDCAPAFQGSAPSAGMNSGYEVGGQSRRFFLGLPSSSFTGPRPVFVAFNGTGESGPSFYARAQLEDFVDRGFIVIAPSSNANGVIWPVWDAMHDTGTDSDPNPDLLFFDGLLRCVAAHNEVDAKRIYVGGHSAGGIMTNYVLQRRSSLVAGGIVGSGVYDLTQPVSPTPLDGVAVIVTWGGDNDMYSGGSSGVSVPEINFVEQASLASLYYEAQPNVGAIQCRGNNLGHAWLDEINGWMIDYLLAHPKGISGEAEVSLPALPTGSPAVCSADAYVFVPTLTVSCPSTGTLCGDACQMVADCGVENSTVGPILGPQLTMLGFSGEDNVECGGCVSLCNTRNTNAADAEALTCMQSAAAAATCGPGISGALPVIRAIDECCMGKTTSTFCRETCSSILTNSSARSFFPNCMALVGS